MNMPRELSSAEVSDTAWAALARMYGQPGVKDAVLGLQDQAGVCVTGLLTLVWSAADGHGAATEATVSTVVAATEELESAVLRPYRRARNGLRERAGREASAEVLRRRLLDQELELERYIQERVLEVLAPASARETDGDRHSDVERVVARYLGHRGAVAGTTVKELKLLLGHAAFG